MAARLLLHRLTRLTGILLLLLNLLLRLFTLSYHPPSTFVMRSLSADATVSLDAVAWPAGEPATVDHSMAVSHLERFIKPQTLMARRRGRIIGVALTASFAFLAGERWRSSRSGTRRMGERDRLRRHVRARASSIDWRWGCCDSSIRRVD